MSVSLAGYTLKNPYHDGGYQKRARDVGGMYDYADGSLGEDYHAGKWNFELRWRAGAAELSDILDAIAATRGSSATFSPHDEVTEYTVKVEHGSFRVEPVANSGGWADVYVTLMEV